jgi:hypothetical protein
MQLTTVPSLVGGSRGNISPSQIDPMNCAHNKGIRTYAIAPLAPQIWGELDLLPPRLGGIGVPWRGWGERGGKTMVFA